MNLSYAQWHVGDAAGAFATAASALATDRPGDSRCRLGLHAIAARTAWAGGDRTSARHHAELARQLARADWADPAAGELESYLLLLDEVERTLS